MHNVVLITLDCVRPDHLRCYNPDALAETPVLDELAGRSAVFTQAITAFPGTPISIASILTGTTPVTNGCVMIGKEYIRPLDQTRTQSISEILRDHGYETAGITPVSLLSEDLGYARGFRHFECLHDLHKREHDDLGAHVTDRATEWLARTKGHYFLWLHYFDAHGRYRPPEPYCTRYRDRPYAGEIAYVDSQLRRLMEHVDLDHTIVVVTADHGESFGEHGVFIHGNFFEENLRVPLILSVPGRPATRVHKLVRSIDIVPTILNALGIEDKPKHCEGVSLLPFMEDQALDLSLTAYCGTAIDDGTIYAAIRTARYKLIVDNYSQTAYHELWPGRRLERIFGKAGMWLANVLLRIRHRRKLPLPYRAQQLTKKFLFDLELDPSENLNLFGPLDPYVTGIGRRRNPRRTFPTLRWDEYDAAARELEEKLRAYLGGGVSAAEMRAFDKSSVVERLRSLGYVE